MPETPYDRFEYPPAEEPLWYKKGLQRSDLSENARASIPPDFFEQTYDGLVDWLEQLEISVQGMVAQRIDLPEPDPDVKVEWTLPNGNDATQRRVFIVLDELAIVYDDGTQWETLAGLGSEGAPLPPLHTEEVNTAQVNADAVEGGALNAQTISKRDQAAFTPQLVGHHYQLESTGAVLDVSFDTRDFENGEIFVFGHFTTAGTLGATSVNMRVSGYSGPNYRQVDMSGTGISNSQDNTSWTLGQLGLQYGSFSCEYTIDRPRSRPVVRGEGSPGTGSWDQNVMERGALIGTDVFSIDTIDFFTPVPIYKAEIEVWAHELGTV